MSRTGFKSAVSTVVAVLIGALLAACGAPEVAPPSTGSESAFSIAVGDSAAGDDGAAVGDSAAASDEPETGQVDTADDTESEPAESALSIQPQETAEQPETTTPTPAPTEPPRANVVEAAPSTRAPQVLPGPDEESVADLIDRVGDGVVYIEVRRCGDISAGTGFIVGDDRIVTAAHVVDGADNVAVAIDNTRVESNIVGIDIGLDLAVLSVPQKLTGWHFTFAESVRIGDDALVMGYPAALDFTVTQGSVTAVNAKDPYVSAPVIRFDAAANPGNSGGPVTNRDGEVIGVVSGSRTDLDSVNYAIDAKTTKATVSSWAGRTPHAPESRCDTPAPAPKAAADEGNKNNDPENGGYVTVTAQHRDAGAVDRLFEIYVGGINTGHTENSWAVISKNFQSNLGTQADFAAGNRTSKLHGFTVTSITETNQGLAVNAEFVSTQDAALGPNGWPCAAWSLTYKLVGDGSGYLIDGAEHRQGSPAPCDVE